MSYLSLPNGISDFNKAVISLWFRVPKESIDAASKKPLPDNRENDLNTYFPALLRTIPLVTFGSLETAITDKGYGSGAYPVAPSYIGVDCTRDRSPQKDTLAVHLSMSNNSTFEMTPMESDGYGPPPDGQPQFIGSALRKEAFYMCGNGSRPYYGDEPSLLEVKPDTWHHILISLDLTIPAVVHYSTAPQSVPPFPPAIRHPRGGPTFMWAFDDVDKTDWSLSPSCAQVYNVQPSGSVVVPAPVLPLKQITTNNLILVPGGAWAFIGTWSPVPIKSSNPIGIPASPVFVDNIYHVEMAEFQMFTDVVLDTSVKTSRRAFIDFQKDAKGKPILDKDGKGTMKSVPPNKKKSKEDLQPGSIELLKKRPEILLHGSGNWIHGNNSGSTGATEGGKKLSGGQFKPTGKILKYTPDPSLQAKESA